MNEKKFAFIICTNDSLLLEECIHYINHLIVPDGYEVELLTIPDAPYMTYGYNEGMHASDAKYKIYMHQDVFILNKNILNDLLSVFHADAKIGMVGMIGYDEISPDGIMWHGDRYGNIYQHSPKQPYPDMADYRYSLTNDGYRLVAEIDGFFMATCTDLQWNMQELQGWDFYDAFQSIQFLLNGYTIAVPVQRFPWCLHDDNKFPNLFHYDEYRQIFMKKYSSFLGKNYREIQNIGKAEESL